MQGKKVCFTVSDNNKDSMKHLKALLLGVTLAVCAPLPLVVGATGLTSVGDGGPVDQKKFNAVRDMLKASGIASVAVYQLRQRLSPALTRDELSAIEFNQHAISDDDIVRLLTPFYAAHLSVSDARKITAAFHSTPGRQTLVVESKRRFSPSQPPVLSRAEEETIAKFNAGAARQHLNQVQASVGKSWEPALESLIAERNAAQLLDGLLMIAAKRKEWLDSGAQTRPERHVPEKMGVPAMDTALELAATETWRNTDAHWRFEEELKKLGMEDILSPENLVSAVKLNKSRLVLVQIESKLDVFMHESGAALKALEQASKQITSMDNTGFGSAMQEGVNLQLGWTASYATNMRAKIDVIRRLLAFCDSRVGKISIDKAGLLELQSDSDLKQFNILSEVLTGLVKEGNALQEQIGKRISDAYKLRLVAPD